MILESVETGEMVPVRRQDDFRGLSMMFADDHQRCSYRLMEKWTVEGAEDVSVTESLSERKCEVRQ